MDPSEPCLGESPVRQEKPISRTPAPLTRPRGIGHPAGVACFPVIEQLARLRGWRAYRSGGDDQPGGLSMW